MATDFPGSKHTFSGTRGSAAQKLNSPNHVTHHTNEDDTSEAIQDKLGTGASTPTDTKLLRGTGVGTSAWDKTAPSGDIVGTTDTQTMTNKTLTSPAINSPDLNMANNAAVTGRNAADSADKDLVKLGTDDIINVGDASVKGVMLQNGCFLHEAGNQDISNNTATDLLFDATAEIYDPLNMHNTSTNTDRIVVPVTGIYEIIASGHWEDDVTDTARILDIKVDGTGVASNRASVDNGGRVGSIVYYVGSLIASSFVELNVLHVGGANLEFRDYSFSVKLVGT